MPKLRSRAHTRRIPFKKNLRIVLPFHPTWNSKLLLAYRDMIPVDDTGFRCISPNLDTDHDRKEAQSEDQHVEFLSRWLRWWSKLKVVSIRCPTPRNASGTASQRFPDTLRIPLRDRKDIQFFYKGRRKELKIKFTFVTPEDVCRNIPSYFQSHS